MKKIVLIYITNPSLKTAKSTVLLLLKKRLIACANIFPVQGVYRWKNRITNEKEFVLIAKTSANKFAAVKRAVEKTHPYSVPCVIKIDAGVNAKYFKWLCGEIE
ncbi:MAG: divalent-cation tolerance protein CutA [Patescibacteria group bacterium]